MPNMPSSPRTPDENADENSGSEEHSPLGTFTLLELENGKCVYTNSVLEFIVRPGSSVSAISPFPEQGIESDCVLDYDQCRDHNNHDNKDHRYDGVAFFLGIHCRYLTRE